ncbi:homer protein homolog 3-like [Trichomycterus rosablanca]|uniref:homer protein homolog 3-like n=1 Tax=Trichomycterus rosablanca TaxID=2290929 RepID=UPI002F360E07
MSNKFTLDFKDSLSKQNAADQLNGYEVKLAKPFYDYDMMRMTVLMVVNFFFLLFSYGCTKFLCIPFFDINIVMIHREQPLFSAKAHVFQIDPATKRNWIPASKHGLTVSFYYDASRSVYRIISVGSTKAVINSTVTPNMTFTKTSQKFGQWADSRANTVYGLGFSTEQQLQQFAEQFKEVKEAARLVREKSQEKFELISPDLNIAAPQALSEDCHSPPSPLSINGPEEDKQFHSRSADMESISEKQHVMKMHLKGSVCEENMETELNTLRESNAQLVAALHEANSSIEQWKKQLTEYQQETDRLREQVAELEEQSGYSASSENSKEELCQSVKEMEALIMVKDKDITQLHCGQSDFGELQKEREEIIRRMHELEERNNELEQQVQKAEQNLAFSMDAQQQAESEVRKVIEVLDVKILDLNNLRQSLAKLVDN